MMKVQSTLNALVGFVLLFGMCWINKVAFAGQSAHMICIDNHVSAEKSQGTEGTARCGEYELHVAITADQDTGKQGVFGIFAISENTNQFAFWTEEKGWSPYSEYQLIKPTEKAIKKLDIQREFVVFKGSAEDLCTLSNGQGFNLYAWHADLSAAQISLHKNFMKKFNITGWQAENFMYSILLKNAVDQKKGGLIYSSTCPAT